MVYYDVWSCDLETEHWVFDELLLSCEHIVMNIEEQTELFLVLIFHRNPGATGQNGFLGPYNGVNATSPGPETFSTTHTHWHLKVDTQKRLRWYQFIVYAGMGWRIALLKAKDSAFPFKSVCKLGWDRKFEIEQPCTARDVSSIHFNRTRSANLRFLWNHFSHIGHPVQVVRSNYDFMRPHSQRLVVLKSR